MQKKLIICLCWAYCLVLFSFHPAPVSAGKISGNGKGNVPETLNTGNPAVSSFQADQLTGAYLVAEAQQDNSSATTDSGPKERKFFPFPKREPRPVPQPEQKQEAQQPAPTLPAAH